MSRARRAAPWIVAGGGAALVITGAALAAVAASRRDGAASQPTGQLVFDDQRSAQQLALGANISFGVGGAILGAGVIWGLVELVQHRRAQRVEARR